MGDSNNTSGEINVLILARITEVASKVEAVANGQNELKSSMMLQFNDGKHRMDGLEGRIEGLEEDAPRQHHQVVRRSTIRPTDDDSDWRPRAPREPKTETHTKVDLGVWIKYGAMIGAAVAGAFAAVKAGSP